MISFWQVEALFSGRLLGLSPFAAKILATNIQSEEKHGGYLRDRVSNVNATLKPGKELIETRRAMVKLLAPAIKELGRGGLGDKELQQWMAEVMMTSVTGSIFGPQNPYCDSDVAGCFR